MSLGPGDLAVIVEHDLLHRLDVARSILGFHVTIVFGPFDLNINDIPGLKRVANPYYRVAGLPDRITKAQGKFAGTLSGHILRKVPPAPMDAEIPDLMEMVGT